MRSVLENLVRARTVGVVLVLFLIAGVLAVSIHAEPWQTVSATVSLGALALALLIIVALQKTEVIQAKSVKRAIGRNQSDSSKALKTQSEELSTLKGQLEDFRNELRDLQAPAAKNSGQVPQAPSSFFSPNRVRSHKILDRPSSQQAGRNAADQVAAGDATKVLVEMLTGEESSWEREVIAVCSPPLRARLAEVANLRLLQPGLLVGAPHPNTAYIVLDERCLNSGVWSGTLDTVGTSDFLTLTAYIKAAKECGALVIVSADRVKSHFNDELRSLADIVVTNGKSDLRWEKDVNLPVLNLVMDESVDV